MRLDATPLRPQFAAKITGIDLGKRIDDELQRAIERAMDEYAVCVLPDQTLQDEQQVAFSRFYGPLEMSPGIGRKPGQAVPANARIRHDEIFDISNLDQNGGILGADNARACGTPTARSARRARPGRCCMPKRCRRRAAIPSLPIRAPLTTPCRRR